MSALPMPPNLADPAAQAFPVLTKAQIERMKSGGKIRTVKPGDIVFSPGDRSVSCFVVLSGGMEVVQPSPKGEVPIVSYKPGQFSGEISLLNGQQCLALGRVTEAGDFLELTPEQFRSLIAKDAELSEILMKAYILRRIALVSAGRGNLILLGSRHSASTLKLREFLGRNLLPFTYVDLDDDREAQELLDQFSITVDEIPVVICNVNGVMKNPSVQKLVDCMGLNSDIDLVHVRDLIIVGAGPAGLAAAVYGASEGLDTLVIETAAPGGQAGSSSRIENYLGFPTGVSGLELAGRALTQAQKFGAQMMVAHSAVRLNCDQEPYRIFLDEGTVLHTRSIVIAAGAQYNKPPITNLEKFEGQGIYYGATNMEAQLCGGEAVIVVGGGNSAGQAAVYLSQTAKKVYLLVRSGELADSMSRYLIQRIVENPNIEMHYRTEIIGVEGGDHLERVTWKDNASGKTSTHDIRHIFIMTGASPRTAWLEGCVTLDSKGFILTGIDLHTRGKNSRWPLNRPPLMLETSLPRVFAVGDVRSGNVKRVAAAVGEGSIAIHLVHRALAEP
jgi:thioredoxin reductase (NADPH)